MRIAVLSDIHDNIWNLKTVLERMPATEALICCGDLCSPFMVALLATSYPQPIHVVFGNNDGDLFRITRNAAKFEHVHLHGEFFDGVFADRRIAVTHYPEIAGAIGSTGSGFDAVCYGHDHRLAIRREADTLWLNPGPIMGYDPIAAAEVPVTFIVYDTVGHQAQGYRVEEGAVVPV